MKLILWLKCVCKRLCETDRYKWLVQLAHNKWHKAGGFVQLAHNKWLNFLQVENPKTNKQTKTFIVQTTFTCNRVKSRDVFLHLYHLKKAQCFTIKFGTLHFALLFIFCNFYLLLTPLANEVIMLTLMEHRVLLYILSTYFALKIPRLLVFFLNTILYYETIIFLFASVSSLYSILRCHWIVLLYKHAHNVKWKCFWTQLPTTIPVLQVFICKVTSLLEKIMHDYIL